MKRKILSLLLTVTMMLGVLTGCGGGSGDSGSGSGSGSNKGGTGGSGNKGAARIRNNLKLSWVMLDLHIRYYLVRHHQLQKRQM